MLKKLLLFSLALMLTVNANSYLNANEDSKIVYEKDYFEQFNITNANDNFENRTFGRNLVGSDWVARDNQTRADAARNFINQQGTYANDVSFEDQYAGDK